MGNINQLIELQQAASAQILLELEKVNIQFVLQSLSPHHFTLDIPLSLPMIDADKRHIEKALAGLVTVITPFATSPDDRNVLITVRVENTELSIRILVEGEGVEYLWRNYANPDLFYSYVVIEKHGGKFSVEKSTNAQEFVILLPITQP